MPFDPKKAFAVAAAVAAGLLLWDHPAVVPLRLLAVLVHEAGHALAAKAVGGEVLSITIDRLEGGLCTFRFDPTFLNKVITGSAGYLGSALGGALLLGAAIRRGSGRFVLALLAFLLLVVCVLWARSLFTVAVTLGLALVLSAAARFLPKAASQALALFIATFIGLYALFDLKDDLWDGQRRAGTDAALLAQTTGIPAVLWALLWTLVGVGLLGLALWGAIRRSPRGASRPVVAIPRKK